MEGVIKKTPQNWGERGCKLKKTPLFAGILGGVSFFKNHVGCDLLQKLILPP